MIEELEKVYNVKFPAGDQLHTAETGEFLKSLERQQLRMFSTIDQR